MPMPKSRAKPWPGVALAERDTAVIELVRIAGLGVALNDMACDGQIFAEGLQVIATYLNDAGGIGLLALRRNFVEIDRWPKDANAARLSAIAVFEKAQQYARVLERVTERPAGLRGRLIKMARELNMGAHEALDYMQRCGAHVDTRALSRRDWGD